MGIVKNRVIHLLILIAGVLVLGAVIYFGKGVNDYLKWAKVKKASAVGGYPWCCGASQITGGMPGCVITSGVCSCPQCEALCDGSTYVQFVGQPSCKGMNFACISPGVKPSGVPILTSRQAILCGTSNMMTANSVAGTQSLAAYRVEKILDYYKVIIAGFKEK